MKAELEKYIAYYLLIYLVIMAVYGFVEYALICNGSSLACKFSLTKIKDVLTIVAAILTPIVAIIIFLSWKDQFNKNLDKEYLTDFLEALRVFHTYTNPIFVEIKQKTSSNLDDFGKNNPKFYYLEKCNVDEILLKINYIDTIITELFYENIGIEPYLLDIAYRANYVINHIERIKNEDDLGRRFNLLNDDFEMKYLSKYEPGFKIVSIVENLQESITRLQYDYMNLVSTIKNIRKA